MTIPLPDLTGQHRDVIVGGRRISYLESGTGPRVCVLIHGLAASWDYWARTVPALVDTHRVIAVDLPGFGRSEDPTAHGVDDQLALLPGFMDAVGIDTCDVAGHSMGTLVACELAARHPDRVDRVVLSGGPITSVIDLFDHPVRTLLTQPRVATFLIEALTAGIRPTPAMRRLILTRSWARWLAFRAYVPHPSALSEDDVNGVLLGVGAPGVFPTLRQGFGYDLRPALAAVQQPTLVIHGARDTICPMDDALQFVGSRPATRTLEVIAGVGHWPMIEAPEAFNDLLRDFLSPEVAPERSQPQQ